MTILAGFFILLYAQLYIIFRFYHYDLDAIRCEYKKQVEAFTEATKIITELQMDVRRLSLLHGKIRCELRAKGFLESDKKD